MHNQPDKWPDAVHESGHAAAACYFGWPIREVSIQAVKTSLHDRVGVCQLGIEALDGQTHEDIMRSIIYCASGPAAEFLLDVETEQTAMADDYDEIRRSAVRAFPHDRKAQEAMMKRGEEAAFEMVRQYRPGIEALAAALVRLGRVEGSTAEHFINKAASARARSGPIGALQGRRAQTD